MSGPEGAYAYTRRGTLESLTLGSHVTTYDFDDLGRLESVDDGVSPVSYSYDSLDRLVSRDSGVVESFSYAGSAIDPTSDGSFVYARSPGGRVLAQKDPVSGIARLVGLNRHGDLSYLFDSSGAVSDSGVYDPFGDEAAETGTTNPTLGFQADFTDPVTDHVWMGARWYDGGWATFLSRDSVFGELRTPVTLNRYTYGGANPLKFWDPDGQAVEIVDGVFCSTIDRCAEILSDISTCGSPGCRSEVEIGTAIRKRCVAWRDSTGCTAYETEIVTGSTNPKPTTSEIFVFAPVEPCQIFGPLIANTYLQCGPVSPLLQPPPPPRPPPTVPPSLPPEELVPPPEEISSCGWTTIPDLCGWFEARQPEAEGGIPGLNKIAFGLFRISVRNAEPDYAGQTISTAVRIIITEKAETYGHFPYDQAVDIVLCCDKDFDGFKRNMATSIVGACFTFTQPGKAALARCLSDFSGQ